jgi:hypothetical protein
MDKIYGATGRQDGLDRIGQNKYELFYGFGKDNESAETGYNYRQRFSYKPSLEEIKETIKATINEATAAKIQSGFVWEGINVWLSMEQQANFNMIASSGIIFPVTLKLGEDANGEPRYYEFESVEEFNEFRLQVTDFILKTLKEGYEEKDALEKDMSAYID